MKVRSHILSPSVARGIAVLCAAVFVATARPAHAGINVWTSHGPPGGAVQALAIDPHTPQTLYAGTQGAGVFKSTDAGATWEPASTGLGNANYIFALAIDPNTPRTLYAGDSLGRGVFKSTDGGSTWSALNPGLTTSSVYALVIDPLEPRRVYAGGYGGGVFAIEQVAVVGTGTADSCTDAALNTALAGGGVVTFDCGPDPVTIDISTGTGTKTIAADTTVDGGGLVTISGGNSVRVFSVNVRVTFTVQNLAIADGNSVKLCGSQDTGGGAIFNNGTLTVTNSTFSGNSAPDSCEPLGAGGAIFTDGTLTVTDSTFSGNSATGAGAIFNNGTLTVTNSAFSGNSAADRPGIACSGGGAGAIFNGGTLTVTNSTFSGNSSVLGGAISNSGTLTVTNSTFSGNNGGCGGGGGIANFGDEGTLQTVTNSTFSGNNGSGENGGGGILNLRGNGVGTLTVTNSTFSDNIAGLFPGGGGILNEGGPLTVTNTILANSTSGGNCGGRLTDGGHNIDDGTTCGFSEANGSLSNVDPELDPAGLQDNGGPTETVALCTGVDEPAGCTAASPAIDAGDQAVCDEEPVNNLDQRGYLRPGTSHTQCSIGAYEADGIPSEACTGDCDGNGVVAIDELILGVNIALDRQQVNTCPAFENSQGTMDVMQLVKGVNNTLYGCGSD